MCGIIGYVGSNPALLVLLQGLERLEYRGYDSAGVALIENGSLYVEKKVGKIRELVRSLWGKELRAVAGIGHTRWATHGEVCELNAHPHTDSRGEFALVHNGIIENYRELKEELERQGVEYRSQTDTEAIVHLIALNYDGDLLRTVLKVIKRLKGAYAFAVISTKEPNRIVAVRYGSPLVVGVGKGENFIAADIPALLPFTRTVIPLGDGEVVDLRPDGFFIYDFEGNLLTKEVMHIAWDVISAEKGGFKHFMLKEIFEQPRTLGDTIKGYISRDYEMPINLRDFRRVLVVACGTSYHAGLVGKYWIEKYAKVPVEVVYASELRYSDLYNSSKYRSPLEQIEKEFKIKADVDKKDGSIKIEVIHSSPEVAAKFNLALIKEVNSRINQLYSPGKDINYLIITSMPETPYEPYFPKKFKIVFLSTFSAFLLSIFIALFMIGLEQKNSGGTV